MPTTILFDSSLSMLRPVVADDPSSESRRVLAEHGIGAFLDALKSFNPLEYVALLSFSSSCDVAVPFTRDLDSIRAGVLEVETWDKTLLQRAIRGAGEYLLTEFGPYAPSHVVVVTDGSQGANMDDAMQKSLGTMQFPIPGSVHVVLLSRGDELNSSVEEFYRKQCSSYVSNPGDVLIPDGPLSQSSVAECMQKLAERLHAPFNGRLTCGHLQGDVCLVPRPFFLPAARALRHTASCAGHSAVDAAVAAINSASASSTTASGSVGGSGGGSGGGGGAVTDPCEGTALHLPSKFEVCGFLEQSSVAGPPILARHLVLDPSSSVASLSCSGTASSSLASRDQRSKSTGRAGTSEGEASGQLSTGSNIRLSTASPTADGATESSPALQIGVDTEQGEGTTAAGASSSSANADGKKPSFRVLLHASLRVEALVALVRFRKDWFGLLMSAADSKKKANLVLSIFAPGCQLPWLGGRLSMLGPSALLQQETGLTRKRRHSEASGEQSDSEPGEYRPSDYLPVPPITPPSFNSLSGLTWARQQNIQNDVTKVMKFARRLPEKINAFLRETNRVRHTALCYGLTELLEVLSEVLLREQTTYPMGSYPQQQLNAIGEALLTQLDPDKPLILQPINVDTTSQ
ncbi:integrator complex subunit 14-like [Sycon ciliatum]|uniref:integrator complex subunit 14-like n=1 Tax=Sycon ciliatum TaxID=27933 RepID=UPI0031F69FB0